MFSWFTLTSLLHRFAYKILYWSISNQLVIFIISFSLSVSYLYKTIYKLEQLIVRSAVLYNGTADHEELQGTQESTSCPSFDQILNVNRVLQQTATFSTKILLLLFFFLSILYSVTCGELKIAEGR